MRCRTRSLRLVGSCSASAGARRCRPIPCGPRAGLRPEGRPAGWNDQERVAGATGRSSSRSWSPGGAPTSAVAGERLLLDLIGREHLKRRRCPACMPRGRRRQGPREENQGPDGVAPFASPSTRGRMGDRRTVAQASPVPRGRSCRSTARGRRRARPVLVRTGPRSGSDVVDEERLQPGFDVEHHGPCKRPRTATLTDRDHGCRGPRSVVERVEQGSEGPGHPQLVAPSHQHDATVVPAAGGPASRRADFPIPASPRSTTICPPSVRARSANARPIPPYSARPTNKGPQASEN